MNVKPGLRILIGFTIIIIAINGCEPSRNVTRMPERDKQESHKIRVMMGDYETELLLESRSIADIKAWVAQSVSTDAAYHSVETKEDNYLVIIYDIGSGRYVLNYIIYKQSAHYSRKLEPQWRAIAEGPLMATSDNYHRITAVYYQDGCIVIMSENPEMILRVPV